ncbi:MAG: hypothetical protein GWO08_06175 [Gammaproteobacteria bacterium]|nr:hypothetical protein [Gammaproteobacteria bacterium]
MKLVAIVFNTILLSHVMEHLNQCNVAQYTQWSGATGVGSTDPHLGTHVWPGTNNIIFSVVDDPAKKDALLNCVKAIQKEHPNEGIRAFVMPVEEMV